MRCIREIAFLCMILAARPARSEPLSRTARELAAAARAAGVSRVAVSAFANPGRTDPGAGREAAARFAALFARDGRVATVARGGTAGPAAGSAAQAVLLGTVIEEDGRRRVLARLVDARTGVLLAAADAEYPSAAPTARAQLFDRARALLGDAPAYGPGKVEAADRLIAILETAGGAAAVRAPAALALGHLGGARVLGALGAALGDLEPEVRGAAALALGIIGDPAGLVRVGWAARADVDEDVRRSAALALKVHSERALVADRR